jgi:hypothetical protein
LTRKLIALDLVLLLAAALLAVQVRREWLSANSREQAFRQKKMNPTPAPALAPLVQPAPLTAGLYAMVAQVNLFSKDRNSNVVLDPVVQPVPKPVPPFPIAGGVMLWEGVPPTVVLSEKLGSPQKGYHPGDKVGEWQVVSVDTQYLILEWDGKQFKKRLDELLDKNALTVAEVAPQAGPSTPAPTPDQVQQLTPKAQGPSDKEVAPGIKACVPGDTSPAGAVVGGMKKVVTASPFGSVCRWEPAR